MELTKGTRVYNHGDQKNPSHFGTITAVREDASGGKDLLITPDAETDNHHNIFVPCQPYWVCAIAFSEVYEGNGMTRFVLEETYLAWRKAKLEKFLSSAA